MEFNATFLVSIVSFILFTLIMNRIFYRPLENIINERNKFINDNILDAKLANEKADAIAQDRDAKLAKSLVDAKAIVNEKVNEANKNSSQITEQAKQKSKEDIKSAKQSLLEEAKLSEDEIKQKINEIADAITSKVLNKMEQV